MDESGESYEIIFVNERSRDKTPDIAADICHNDKHTRLINFSRNFGHQIAISAGKVTASLFYRFLRNMTSVNIPADIGDFRLIDRKVCDTMKLISYGTPELAQIRINPNPRTSSSAWTTYLPPAVRSVQYPAGQGGHPV